MGCEIINEAHKCLKLKKSAIRESNKDCKPATDTVNVTEDIDNKNDESSENCEMEVIYEGTIDKEVMVPEKLRVTKQSQKTTHKIIAED